MRKILIALVAVGSAVAWTAGATLVTATHTHSQGVGYENASFDGGTSYADSYLGRFVMSVAGTTTLPANYPVYSYSDHPYSFYSYCLEPGQNIGVGHGATYGWEIGSLVGTGGVTSESKANMIKELFGRYSPLLSADPTGPYTGGTFRTAASALQLAIWEINLDAGNGAWNLSAGNMRVNSTITEGGANKSVNAVALAMLNSLDGNGPMASGLMGFRSPTAQDVMIQAVPEPSTYVAGALMLLPFGVGMVRKLRANRTA